MVHSRVARGRGQRACEFASSLAYISITIPNTLFFMEKGKQSTRVLKLDKRERERDRQTDSKKSFLYVSKIPKIFHFLSFFLSSSEKNYFKINFKVQSDEKVRFEEKGIKEKGTREFGMMCTILVIKIHFGEMSRCLNVYSQETIIRTSQLYNISSEKKVYFKLLDETFWHINAKLSCDLKRIGAIFFFLYLIQTSLSIYIFGHLFYTFNLMLNIVFFSNNF